VVSNNIYTKPYYLLIRIHCKLYKSLVLSQSMIYKLLYMMATHVTPFEAVDAGVRDLAVRATVCSVVTI
jgi:hypothetical protein